MSANDSKRALLTRTRAARGFTLAELVIVLAIMMVASAIAIPQVMSVLRTYQLNSAAGQVADAIKFTRFEAIRKNTGMTCLAVSASGTSYTYAIGTDSNANGTLDSTERQYRLSTDVTFLTTSNVPTSSSLASALGVSAFTVLSANSSTQKIAFDSRGAINFGSSTGGATTVYVFYVGQGTAATGDYRAVVVMPSGVTQIWAGGATQGWTQLS
jgi:prepilin-type N-terminal cleavage/methylation domain-containing protein